MTFDRYQPNFVKLVKLLKEGKRRVIPFIGSGLSVYGTPAERLPTWMSLVKRIRDRAIYLKLLTREELAQVDSLIEERKLEGAISELGKALKQSQFRLLIEELLDSGSRPLPPSMIELVCVAWSLIITTNLDTFIERAWSKKQNIPLRILTNKDTGDAARAIAGHNSDSTLLKTHGSIDRYDTWVLTTEQYEQLLLENEAYVEALKLLYTQTLLFIGYGLKDLDFEPLLEQLKKIYPEGVGNFFALLEDRAGEDPRIKEIVRNYGVQPIWFSVHTGRYDSPDSGYGEVRECLSLIVEAWVSGNKETPIELRFFPDREEIFLGRNNEKARLNEYLMQSSVRVIQLIGLGGNGKTTLTQKWLSDNTERLQTSDFEYIFGCSFYKADIGLFINSAHSALCKNEIALDIPSKVSSLKSVLFNRRILLIWDGLEAVQSEDGSITNPYLQELIYAIMNGASTLLITTRIKCNIESKIIEIGDLGQKEAITFLSTYGVKGSEAEIRYAIENHIGAHPLSLRVVAGFLREDGANNLSVLQGMSLVNEIPDDADPLRANKARRVLDFYNNELTAFQHFVIKIFCQFRRSVPYVLARDIIQQTTTEFEHRLPETEDVKAVMNALLARRLIIKEDVSRLTCHPLVRDYFKNLDKEASNFVHRKACDYFIKVSDKLFPDTLEECYPLIEACYHSARAFNWERFHEIFYARLNRGSLKYLGYVLGAWQEYLSLASMTFPDSDLKEAPLFMESYYRGSLAVSFRRLGRNTESVDQYFLGIMDALKSNFDTENQIQAAIHINCFMSLCLSMGEIDWALALAPLNIASVELIEREREHDWQLEHALITIGRLAANIGDLDAAVVLFEASNDIRKSTAYNFREHHSLERVFLTDLLLAFEGEMVDKAGVEASLNLEIAEEQNFRDVEGAALRARAAVWRMTANAQQDLSKKVWYLAKAKKSIDKAYEIARYRTHEEMVIQVLLEYLVIYQEISELTAESKWGDSINTIEERKSAALERLVLIYNRSRYYLYAPGILTTLGRITWSQGMLDRATHYCEQAIRVITNRGDFLSVLHSGMGLLSLSDKLGIKLEKRIGTRDVDWDAINKAKWTKEEIAVRVTEIYRDYQLAVRQGRFPEDGLCRVKPTW